MFDGSGGVIALIVSAARVALSFAADFIDVSRHRRSKPALLLVVASAGLYAAYDVWGSRTANNAAIRLGDPPSPPALCPSPADLLASDAEELVIDAGIWVARTTLGGRSARIYRGLAEVSITVDSQACSFPASRRSALDGWARGQREIMAAIARRQVQRTIDTPGFRSTFLTGVDRQIRLIDDEGEVFVEASSGEWTSLVRIRLKRHGRIVFSVDDPDGATAPELAVLDLVAQIAGVR